MTALAIMALVNMCNYSEDIKQILKNKQGFTFISDLMKQTDEDILLNSLRLLMTYVKPKAEEQVASVKQIADIEFFL